MRQRRQECPTQAFDDDQVADASKPRQDRPKPEPKEKQQNANSVKEEKPADQQQAEQQNGDEQKKTGDKGSGGDGEEQRVTALATRGTRATAKAVRVGRTARIPKAESGRSDSGSEKPANDPRSFPKGGRDKGGDGSESKSQDGSKDSKGKNGDEKSPEQKSRDQKREQNGSESSQDAKPANDKGENQPGKPAAEKPQPGSQSESLARRGRINQTGKEINQTGRIETGKSRTERRRSESGSIPRSRSGDGSNPDLKQQGQPQSPESRLQRCQELKSCAGDKEANANPPRRQSPWQECRRQETG